MSDLFVSSHLIPIDIHYKVTKNQSEIPIITVLTDAEAEKLKADPKQKESVRKLATKWRRRNFKMANDLLSQSLVYNHLTNRNDINPVKHRMLGIYYGMVEWSGPDVVNPDGSPLPCTQQNIDNLDEEIVDALLTKYEQTVKPDVEQTTKN